MITFRLYTDKEKGTEYLNEMSRKGYAMTGFLAGFFHFEACRPGEYLYQVDLTEGFFRVKKDYREFMREMNVEIVCLWGPWVILRKKAEEGPFELYTDVESSIEYYERARWMFKIAAVLEIAAAVVELVCAANSQDKAVIGMSLGFACLLTALAIVFIRQIVRLDKILAGLRERSCVEPGNSGLWGRRKPSVLLPIGLLLNGIALMITETEGPAAFWFGFARGFLHVVSLFCLIAGILYTCHRKR